MVATKRGIYHNLQESKYIISNSDIVYFFSSELYMQKFLDGYKENRLKMSKANNKLYNTYNVDIGLDFTALHDVLFYRMIEKRGFRINFMGVDISWQETISFALRRMIEPNIKDYEQIPMQKFVTSKINMV